MLEESTQWEYYVHSLGTILRSPKDEEVAGLLDEIGEDGWELVTAVRGDNTNRLTLIAKRPLTVASRRRRSMP